MANDTKTIKSSFVLLAIQNLNPLYFLLFLPYLFIINIPILNHFWILFSVSIILLSQDSTFLSKLIIPRFFSWIFLLLFGIILIFKSIDFNTGIINYLHHFLIPFVIFFIFVNINWDEKKLLLLINNFIISAVIISLYSIFISYDSGFNLKLRISSTWIHVNMVAGYLMINLFFCLLFFIHLKNSFQKKLFYIISFVLILLGVFLTQTRGIWLAIIVGILFYFVKRPKIILPALGFLAIFFIAFRNVIADRFLSIMFFTSDISTLGRLQAWLTSLTLIKANPFWGYGFGTFEGLRDSVFSFYFVLVINSHNTFLHLIFEIGLIATIIYLSFYIKSIFLTFKLLKQISENIIFKCFIDSAQIIFISLLVAFMFEPYLSIYGHAVSMLIWILISLVYSIYYKLNNN